MKAQRAEDQAEAPVEQPSPAAPAPAVVATVEHWAEKRGMLARFLAPIGEFERPNPSYQDYAQARAHGNWHEGMQMTEAEFDKAIADAKAHCFR